MQHRLVTSTAIPVGAIATITAVVVLVTSGGCSDSAPGADGGPGDATQQSTDGGGTTDGSSAAAPIPANLQQVVIDGFGNLKLPNGWGYTITIDLTQSPPTLVSSFTQGAGANRKSCGGSAPLNATQATELDRHLGQVRLCPIAPGGAELCATETIAFYPVKGEETGRVIAVKKDTGCGHIDRVLCQNGPALYAFVSSILKVDDPAACPAGYETFFE